LVSATGYDFYIQDSCGAGNNSAWVGPFHFETTNACPKVTNLRADSITATSLALKWTNTGLSTRDYVIAWGISGTVNDPTIAIQQNTSSTRFLFSNLLRNTSYDFFVRSNCNASISNSGWVGPVTYKTDSLDAVPTGIGSTNPDAKLLRIYPNPATDKISVELLGNNAAGFTNISIFNSLGMNVYSQAFNSNNALDIPVSNLPEGIYQIEIRAANKRVHQPIFIQHR